MRCLAHCHSCIQVAQFLYQVNIKFRCIISCCNQTIK
ncbi:unnamed protein product [Brassica oleracea var. botrytis]|uniref:(rape) hypothetical protein n=1 Tax=Brassica napus TaxID=3708 RepID=A0A816IIA2_BRANA|nr:unnamed protein product [Brassica napus]